MTMIERLNNKIFKLELGHIEFMNVYGKDYDFTNIKKSEDGFSYRYEDKDGTQYITCRDTEELLNNLTNQGLRLRIESVIELNGSYKVLRG